MNVQPTLLGNQQRSPIEESRTTNGIKSQITTRKETKLSVLIVDDVLDNSVVFSFILKHAGYHTVTATSGPDAIAAAKREKFDLILSDIGMPGMDGYEFVERLRELPNYSTVPIIAVTGYSEYEDHQRAFLAGFNAHLKKPVQPAKLLELVARLESA